MNAMRVGLVYDLFEHYPWQPGDPADADAEYEPEETLLALEEALRLLGHTPVRIGPARTLLQQLSSLTIDVAVNIAESYGSRNREAHAPILLELAHIPYIGSDALTLSVSLDKAWTKDLALAAGVPTPPYRLYRKVAEITTESLPGTFPLFVKPRYEGTAKGILPESKVHSLEALQHQVTRIIQNYRQDALVEPFIEGAEYTVAIIGNDPPQALPVLQRAVEKQTGIGLHALERKGVPQQSWTYEIPGEITPQLENTLKRVALNIYNKLECKDFARVDFRVDPEGNPWFLEINPLPTFAPDGTFAIIAQLSGEEYPSFLARVLEQALNRALREHPSSKN